MNELNSLFNIINWELPNYSNFLTDLESIFHSFYRFKTSSSDRLDAWRYVIKRDPFAAYYLYYHFSRLGLLYETEVEIQQELIAQASSLDASMSTHREASSYVSTLVLLHIHNPVVDAHLRHHAEYIQICNSALENIERLPNTAINILVMLEYLFKIIPTHELETLIKKSNYNLNLSNEEYPILVQLICHLFDQGAFRLAYLICKSYNTSFADLPLDESFIFDTLKRCHTDNFYRGALIYKTFINTPASIDNLRKWYYKMTTIQTDIALQNLPSFRFMFLCESLQLQPAEPEKVLQYISVNLSKLNDFDIYRKDHLRMYRKTIHTLLLNHQSEWLVMFLKQTEAFNIDKYISKPDFFRPSNIREHIGNYNPDLLLSHLTCDLNDMSSTIYIYMNSFLRSIISISEFIDALYQKYGTTISSAFNSYLIGGTIYHDSIRNIYYFTPRTVLKKQKEKLFIHQSCEIFISNNWDHLSQNWYQTKFVSYSPETKVLKFIPEDFFDYQLRNLSKLLHDHNHEHNNTFSDELLQAIQRTSLPSIHNGHFETLVELSINVLEHLVCSSNNNEHYAYALELLAKINYFAYTPTKNYSNLPTPKQLAPHYYRHIVKLWKYLSKRCTNIDIAFSIYCNTILHYTFSLSEFIEVFLQPANGTIHNFINNLPTFYGKIRTFSNTTCDSIIFFIEPFAFKKQNNRFSLEIPLHGISSTQFRKQSHLTKGTFVSFEIDTYLGNGDFNIRNISPISIN